MWTDAGGAGPRPRWRRPGAGSALLALVLLAHCAAFNRKNTPLVVAVEEHLVPKSTTGKIVAFPLILPVGIVAGLLDVFIVHPVSVVPNAAADVRRLIWEPQKQSGYVTVVGSVPFKLVATPILFALDWLARSAFDFGEGSRQAPERPKMEGRTFADLIAAARPDEAARHLYRRMAVRETDESASIRKLFAALHGQQVRVAAVEYLCQFGRFKQNEQFLVDLLREALRSPQSNPFLPRLLSQLASEKSEPGSAVLLDALRDGALEGQLLAGAVNTIVEIGVKAHVDALKSALQRMPQ